MASKLQSIVLIAVSLYVLQLGITDDLDFYIHPRYIIFTFAMASIGLVLMLTSYTSEHDEHNAGHKSGRLAMIPLGLMLLFALLPAKSLTSSTVTQRSTDAGSIVTTSDSKPINTLFAGSSKGLKLADWSRLLSSSSDESYYANKPAKVSGFVYDSGLGQDTVWIARFVVTCCAVDAQPIGVPVHIKNWENTYEEDQWLEIEGEFTNSTTSEGDQLILKPTSVTEIDQPERPYAN